MTSGAITYYYLKNNNPEVLNIVIQNLSRHPWIESRWLEYMKQFDIPSENKDVALFMFASIFSDDVRKIPEYGGGDKSMWHYVD